MKPIEIIDKLTTLKTEKAKSNFLATIPAINEFWIGAYHGMRPLIPYPVEFGISDPSNFGSGVPLGVFPKILNGIQDGLLNETTAVDAISAFCIHCNGEEWKRWYRPILEKKLRLPINLTLFNKHCPKSYKIENFKPSPLKPIKKETKLPRKFVLEPYLNVPRLFLFLKNKRNHVFLEDGTPVHRLLPKAFERFVTDVGIVLDVYEDDTNYVVRDILLESQMLDPTVKIGSPIKRLEIISSVLDGAVNVEAIEFENFIGEKENEIRDSISLFIEAGYSGIVLRTEEGNLLINPTKKNVLTCTEIVPGEKRTKWENSAEYLIGTGKREGRNINTPVYHGLIFDDRKRYLDNREDYIGKKFQVLSCGLSSDGSLLFPVFKHWERQK